MTITGMAADLRMVGGSGSQAGRRLVAVAAMLAGALLGAALILRVRSTYPLVIAVVLAAVVAVAARPARSPAQPRAAGAGPRPS